MKYLQVLVVLCYGFTLDASFIQPVKETQALIRGGELVTDREFPYIVEINKNDPNDPDSDILLCSGTLISSTWVLTAASCVKKDNNETYDIANVKVGRNTRPNDDVSLVGTQELQEVALAVVHRNYTPTDGAAYDIAMLKLRGAISFSSSIKPANLTSSRRIGFIGQMVGWGMSSKYDDSTLIEDSRDLLKLTVSLHEPDEFECKAALSTPIGIGQFCAISPSGTAACKLDAGGPMVSEGEVIGVLSKGNNNCTTPSIYVEVYPLLNWIYDVRNNETYGKDDVPSNAEYKVFEQ